MPNKKAPKGRDLKKAKAKAGQIAKADHKRRVKLGLDTGKKTKKPPPVKPVILPKRQSTQALIRDPSRRVLLVGEGNFSFALALLRLRNQQPGVDRGELPSGANLTATGFDSESTVLQKYPDAADILRELDEAHVRVLHEVDATDIQRRVRIGSGKKGTGPPDFAKQFDRIIFNFPHVGKGIKDEARNVAENQALLIGFFRSAMPMLRPGGEINITLKKGKPYDLWNLKGLGAKLTLGSMKYETALHFDVDAYPGYTHRRTIGFKEGVSATDNEDLVGSRCLTHVWRSTVRTVASAPPQWLYGSVS